MKALVFAGRLGLLGNDPVPRSDESQRLNHPPRFHYLSCKTAHRVGFRHYFFNPFVQFCTSVSGWQAPCNAAPVVQRGRGCPLRGNPGRSFSGQFSVPAPPESIAGYKAAHRERIVPGRPQTKLQRQVR